MAETSGTNRWRLGSRTTLGILAAAALTLAIAVGPADEWRDGASGAPPSEPDAAERPAPSRPALERPAPAGAASAGPVPPVRPETVRPFGEPSAAKLHHDFKRLPLDRTVDAPALYRAAERHLASMPRYSVALGRRLQREELGALGGAAGMAVDGGSVAGATLPEPMSSAAARRELRGKWRALGPGNIGGRTRTLVIDPVAPGTMYAGGVSGGIWKTTNAGNAWRAVGDGMANVAVNALAMNPKNRRNLYAGTGEGYFREVVRGTGLPLRGGGIFRSNDSGESWELLGSTDNENFLFVNDIVISPRVGRRLYAATRTGVWRSKNRGRKWTQILETDVQGGCLDLEIRPDHAGDVLFASCGTFEQASVWRTNNGAKAAKWTEVLSEPGMGRTSLAIARSSPNVIYALSASNQAGRYEQGLHAVFRSDAGGDPGSWEARVRNTDSQVHNTLMLHNPVNFILSTCGFQGGNRSIPMGWYVNTIAVDPADPDIVWVAGVDWFRSDDGGNSWGAASYWWDPSFSSFAHADQHVMAFHPEYDGVTNRVVLVGNDGGIWRSFNSRAGVGTGSTGVCNPANASMEWHALNNGLGITQFYHGIAFPDGQSWIGGTQDNGTVVGGEATGLNGWTRPLGGDGGYVAINPQNTNLVYAETQNGDFRKSVDGGLTFFTAQVGLESGIDRFLDDNGNYAFITPIALDPNDPSTIWYGGRRLYRTRNDASSWQQASATLKGDAKASAFAVAPGNSNRVLVGSSTGFLFRHTGALGTGPATVWPSSRPRQAWVTWVAIDPRDNAVMYATYGGFGGDHVFRSLDGGKSWASIDGDGPDGLPDIPVHNIVIDPDNNQRLFLGTDLGVFVSADGGGSWAAENAGFGSIVTESLHLQREGGKLWLYAFTHGRGAWKSRVREAR